ncbi:MAG: hypothetical protein Q8P31_04415 [Bacillota bacterium]|nr:hypothetical protein [Bacillota bacterium]
MTGRARARSLAVLLVGVALALGVLPCRAALANWTFGPEYEVRVETFEYRNAWYLRHVYWRPAYLNGVYQFDEFTHNVDVYQGPLMSYGPPDVAGQSIEYCDAPHASLVVRYHRAVYRYGQLAGYEDLPDLTRVEDVCSQYQGQEFAQSAVVVQVGGTTMLRVTYSYPIYHANPGYGAFTVGYGQREELTPMAGNAAGSAGGAGTPLVSAPSPDAAGYLDVALRQLDTVEQFDDFALVASNSYAQDIKDAFSLGLIVGKYDETRQYFDPNAAITAGEMINILARNLGATSTTQGGEAAAYLTGLGVSLPSTLDGALSLAALESLASQISNLDQAGKADLLVLRHVLEGTLVADVDGGISRAHAVAMYRPPKSPAPGGTAVLPPSGGGGQGAWEPPHTAPGTADSGSGPPPWVSEPLLPGGLPPDTGLPGSAPSPPGWGEVIFILSD